MGIHTGPVWTRRKQFFGLTLHKVARISALATGGQILLSSETASSLESGAMVRRLGSFALDGFEEPEDLYELRVIPLSATADSLR
jgi:class 3 adenylate cyclase